MPTTMHLPITGCRREAVPHEFVRQDGDTDYLALLLPGFGYTCDMPLFYYAEALLLEAGADVLRVEYAYNRRPGFLDLSKEEQRRWLFSDAMAAWHAARSQRDYRDVTLVGKSLGTLAMGHLLTEAGCPAGTRAVWLTPMLGVPALREHIHAYNGPALLVIGAADPHFDQAALDALPQRVELVVIEGADHRLDIPGAVGASVQAVERVVRAMQAFLAR